MKLYRHFLQRSLLPVFCFFAPYAGYSQQPGLDLSFGANGSVLLGINQGFFAYPVGDGALLPDGKILIGGISASGSANHFTLVKLDANGAYDTTFGNGGIARNPGPHHSWNFINGLALQSDGKIVAVGSSDTNGIGNFTICLMRYNANGSLDSSFDLDGINCFGAGVQGYDVAIAPDGKIVAAGYGAGTFLAARLNSNGTFDNSFGISGIATADFPGTTEARAVAVQPDGKVIVAGGYRIPNSSLFAMARFNNNGSLDTSFDGDGKQTASIFGYDQGFGIALRSDGKIIVGGTAQSPITGQAGFGMIRLNPNGSLDPLFDGDGKVSTLFGSDAAAYCMALLPDNKILLGGTTTSKFALARYQPDGALDNSFYSSGKFIGTSVNFILMARAVLPQPDGKIIAIGGNTYSAARILATSAINPAFLRTDFDGDGKTDISVFRPSLGEWYLLKSANNTFFGQPAGSSADKIVPADYTGDGKTDIAFFRPADNTWYIIRSENQTFYAVPYASPGDIPAPADFDGDGKADLTIFRPSQNLWASQRSSNGQTTVVALGTNGDIPIPADYDGDRKADFTIYRPSAAEWFTQRSSNGSSFGFQFGLPGDRPVQGDYTGDGKVDFALYRPSNGAWFIIRSENQSFYGLQFGAAGDIPVAGDYDGDGLNDTAVYRPGIGYWFIQGSSAGFMATQFGVATDKPLPAYYLP